LCTQWKKIPIEVLPMAAPDVLARLRAMGSSNPTIRSGLPSKAGECVTDTGMWIIDVPVPSLLLSKDLSTGKGDGSGRVGDTWEVEALAKELLSLPGVAEIGLFTGFNGDQARGLGKEMQAQKPIAAFFGMQDGTVQVRRA
jgi:ribose 5-phosphate isomerase A